MVFSGEKSGTLQIGRLHVVSVNGMQQDLPERVVEAIKAVVGVGPVPLHDPCFTKKEWIYVRQCLDSTMVSSIGEFVNEFEEKLRIFTGSAGVVAVINGTAGLHAALLMAGVESNDEVLMPALTFVATANAISYCGARPHFVEVEESSLGIDVPKLRKYLGQIAERRGRETFNKNTGRRLIAVVPVHLFGHVGDLDELMFVAAEYGLKVVEDATEALGSRYKHRHAGTFGDFGVLSFNGNKTITTGGGGAILVRNIDETPLVRHLTTTSKVVNEWDYGHDQIGFNYRMPNLNAALGCAQIDSLSQLLAAKQELYKLYKSAFRQIDALAVVQAPKHCESNYWLQTLLLNKMANGARDEILTTTNAQGFTTRPVWVTMNKLAPYRSCPSMPLSITESLESRLINIPSSSNILLSRDL